MSLKFYIFVFVIFCVVQCIQSEGYYTIVGPKVLRANSKYHISVNSQGLREGITLKIGIENTNPEGENLAFKNVVLEPNTTQMVELDIGNVTTGNYRLTAEGLSGLYSKKIQVELNTKSFSILVQTDKAIYKPGDTVKYRVLILDSNLKPAIIKDGVNIFIEDALQNRIKQWNNVETTKGVFSGEMELSTAPVLGSWHINVDTMGTQHGKTFDVDEYVLPKFEVFVDVPRHGSLKDGRISAIIRSKYTYGKFVKGEVTVSAYPTRSIGSLEPYDQNVINRKTLPLDGKAITDFDIVRELHLRDGVECDVIIEAIVEEALTGRKHNSTATITLHKSKYKIDILPEMTKYIPGLPYSGWVKVSYHDGAPVQDKINQIEIEHKYIRDTGSRSVERILNENGMASFTFKTEKHAQDSITITAKYLDVTETTSASKKEAENNVYIQAKVKTENPTVNNEVEIEVLCTKNIPYLTYQLIGRGDLIETNTVQVPNNTKKHSIKFLPTFAMVPKAKVLVYFIHTDGRIVVDSTNVEFPTLFQNTVKIALSSSQVEPGANLAITITSKPNSFVGLLGVDQSVLLLKKGNDLEKNEIFNELEQYEIKDNSRIRYTVRPIRPVPFHPGIISPPIGHPGIGHPRIGHPGIGHPGIGHPGIGLHGIGHQAIGHHGISHPQPGHMERGRRQPQSVPYGYSNDNNFPDFEDIGTVILTNAKSNHRSYSYPQYGYTSGMPGMPGMASPMWGSSNVSPHMMHGQGGQFPGWQIGHPQPLPPPIKVTIRKKFPETWIYDVIEDNGPQGTTILHKKVPDTITSWIITGFAIDPITGFGMTQAPRKLEVFQPFFISTNLPYSIKRGEIVAIPILVFNYMNDDVVADVVLDNELQEFQFEEISNEINYTPRIETSRTKQVRVKANNGASVSFMVKPKKTGHITIKVTAVCPLAGDGIEKQLLVVPEGVPQYINNAVFIDLRDQSEFSQEIEIDIPKKSVPDSTRIDFSVVGDLLGPTVKNLHKLIRIPSGCGEQNMMTMVPNIVVLNYLNVTNQLTDEIKVKSLKYMETGYQRELTYKHNDGSFSAFGKSDSSGSTWLTAFVAKSFSEASEFIDIDERIISDALSWLSSKQSLNGSFTEVGQVNHKEMQSGAGQGISLTAYTLITFLEHKKSSELYKNTIKRALDYIVRNMDELDDIYSLAIAAYALQLSDHPLKASVLADLQSKAITELGKTYWLKPVLRKKTNRPHYFQPNSVDVEVSAYGLLSYLEAGLITNALPIMKWLVSQRNDKGGFQSTQDTVMGVKALAKIAARIVSPNNNVHVSAEFAESEVVTFDVNNENSMILQSRELPSSIRQVKVKANGNGFAMAQISYKYHVNVTGARPRFNLDPQIQRNSNPDYLQLTVCTSYITVGNDTSSNMVVMEVGFPSGFTADPDSLTSLQAYQGAKRVETKDSDTVVVIYFNSLDSSEVCPTVSGFRTHKVANQKPAPVTVYDYYDNTREARKFYQMPESSLCDICEGEDCESCRSSNN